MVALWELSDEEDVIHSQLLCHPFIVLSLDRKRDKSRYIMGREGIPLPWVTFFTNPRRPVNTDDSVGSHCVTVICGQFSHK